MPVRSLPGSSCHRLSLKDPRPGQFLLRRLQPSIDFVISIGAFSCCSRPLFPSSRRLPRRGLSFVLFFLYIVLYLSFSFLLPSLPSAGPNSWNSQPPVTSDPTKRSDQVSPIHTGSFVRTTLALSVVMDNSMNGPPGPWQVELESMLFQAMPHSAFLSFRADSMISYANDPREYCQTLNYPPPVFQILSDRRGQSLSLHPVLLGPCFLPFCRVPFLAGSRLSCGVPLLSCPVKRCCCCYPRCLGTRSGVQVSRSPTFLAALLIFLSSVVVPLCMFSCPRP